jgi:hypothetical protein
LVKTPFPALIAIKNDKYRISPVVYHHRFLTNRGEPIEEQHGNQA